jgi:hypothetical protein
VIRKKKVASGRAAGSSRKPARKALRSASSLKQRSELLEACRKLFSKRPKVIVIAGGEALQERQHVSRGRLPLTGTVLSNIAIPDRLQWSNEDERPYTLRFISRWPFWDRAGEIEVPAHGTSLIYTVFPGQSPGTYKYIIFGSDADPGEPQIVVDP